MDRELTFCPETERSRDLIYSEYSSFDRSIHILLQESASVSYDLLLKTYREAVAVYVSSENLRPPSDFFRHLLSRFDALRDESAVRIEDWKLVGIHVVLRSVDACYVLSSREADVFLCCERRALPLGELPSEAMQRLRLDASDIQRELFPQKLSELFSVFKLELGYIAGKDVVLGCPEDEKDAVVDVLSGPGWPDAEPAAETRAARRSIVSGHVTRRILVLRLGGLSSAAQQIAGRVRKPRRSFIPGIRIRRRYVLGTAGTIIALLVAGLWIANWIFSNHRTREPSAGVPEDSRGRAGSPSVDKRDAGNVGAALVLSEWWRRTYRAEVTSSPALFGTLVIFGCRDGNVYALERQTGLLSWTFEASDGIGASPVIEGESLVVADYKGGVYTIDAHTGRAIWKRRLPMRVVSTPAVSDGRVLVGCYDGYAYCFSAEDGSPLWKHRTRGRIRGSPLASGGVFLVPSYDGFLYALSVRTGAVVWRYHVGGQISSSPAARGDIVVIGGVDGRVHCLDARAGTRKWVCATGGAVKSSPAVSGERVFVGSNDGGVYALNLNDGSVVWKFPTGDVVLARPCVAEGVVYAASYDARLYALDETTGRLLVSFDAGGPVYSSPAVDEDFAYFGTNRGDFVCLRRRSSGTT